MEFALTEDIRAVANPLPGVFLLEASVRRDERGWFVRSFCRQSLRRIGVDRAVEQANMSLSVVGGTLRGLHYQLGASAETKIVSCVQGALYDVVLDLRQESPTFGQHFASELTAENRRALVVPEGCAHGFLTLQDQSAAFYFVSAAYDPTRERGVRWNDPAFRLTWPFAPRVVSPRDRNHPDFQPGWHLAT